MSEKKKANFEEALKQIRSFKALTSSSCSNQDVTATTKIPVTRDAIPTTTPRPIEPLVTVASLFGDESHADFTFMVCGKSFKAHKCVLAKVSNKFKQMFENNINESIENCSILAFGPFLKFIYTNELPDDEILLTFFGCDLFNLAKKYEITTLFETGLQPVLTKQLYEHNVVSFYELATNFDIPSLRDKTWQFIKSHLNITEICSPKPFEKVREIMTLKFKMQTTMDDYKRNLIAFKKSTKAVKRKLDM